MARDQNAKPRVRVRIDRVRHVTQGLVGIASLCYKISSLLSSSQTIRSAVVKGCVYFPVRKQISALSGGEKPGLASGSHDVLWPEPRLKTPLAATRAMNKLGLSVSVDNLGENVTNGGRSPAQRSALPSDADQNERPGAGRQRELKSSRTWGWM